MKRIFNKLVRDKIPKIIEDNGEYALTEILNDKSFENAIDNKLMEEVKEVINAKTKEDIKEELADLLEVILKKAEINNIKFSEIEEERIEKKNKKGGFDDKIFLVETKDQNYDDENKGSFTCNNRVLYKEKNKLRRELITYALIINIFIKKFISNAF